MEANSKKRGLNENLGRDLPKKRKRPRVKTNYQSSHPPFQWGVFYPT